MDLGGLIALLGSALLAVAAVVVLIVRLRGGEPATGSGGPARLEFRDGPLAGQIVALSAELTTIGSVAGNSVVVSDPAISRNHLEIRRDPRGYQILDLGSTNGFYRNGRRAERARLAAGDVVRVGNTEFVFRC
jgi:hypothetical protein